MSEGLNCDTNPVSGKAICTCPPGYTGSACNQDIDECSLGKNNTWSIRKNIKHNTILHYNTVCISGANPCEHGGRCLNTKGSFQCKCLQGYEGPRCEMDVNECKSNPCQNDATCLDQIGGFHCICMPGMSLWPLTCIKSTSLLLFWWIALVCRLRGCVLSNKHGRLCITTLPQQWKMHRQDQLFPLWMSQRWLQHYYF